VAGAGATRDTEDWAGAEAGARGTAEDLTGGRALEDEDEEIFWLLCPLRFTSSSSSSSSPSTSSSSSLS
jgi:hypothetical protein